MWVINNEGNPWVASLTQLAAELEGAGGNVELNVLSLEEALQLGSDAALGSLILDELDSVG